MVCAKPEKFEHLNMHISSLDVDEKSRYNDFQRHYIVFGGKFINNKLGMFFMGQNV